MTQAWYKPRGFTVVELIIVIIAVAILATIVLVAYNGVTKSAIEATMRSDLDTTAGLLAGVKLNSKNYPDDARTLNGGKGLPATGDNQILYLKLGGDKYCAAVLNKATSEMYRVTSESEQIVDGGCGAEGSSDVIELGGFGLAIDNTGVKYVNDQYGRISKVLLDGTKVFIAGSATPGSADGTGAAAQFRGYKGIALDSAGNIIVADEINCTIRKVTPAGVVSTIGGIAGTCTGVNGPKGTSTFDRPNGVLVDKFDNIYVAETYGRRIRKINTSGVASTIASVPLPTRLTFNQQGDIITVSPWTNTPGANLVSKVTLSGVVTTLAGSGATGRIDAVGDKATFGGPSEIVTDPSGNLIVYDSGNDYLRAVTPGGGVFTIEGTHGLFGGAIVWGMAYDPSGNLWVTQPYWGGSGSRVTIRKVELKL